MPNASTLKQQLNTQNQALQQQFEAGEPIAKLLKQRSDQVDTHLKTLWEDANISANTAAALIAVGGYGRAEMHPASDIDVLILLANEPSQTEGELISEFVTTLWDLGLEIGHSVRTVAECISEAEQDLTVITNVIEGRFLCGNASLFSQLNTAIRPDKLWPSRDFFLAKLDEQAQRYERFGDTAYRVEPNLKDGPGGLRDLQTIGWIVRRAFGIASLKQLSEAQDNDLLNPKEYQELIEARDFLWQVRFALHQLTGRKEDRLLFDYQRQLALSFGYQDDPTGEQTNHAIESFMQRYYKTITQLERLNEILLGLLREHILPKQHAQTVVIDELFANRGNYLELRKEDAFNWHPPTFLAIFRVLQQHPELEGFTPKTLRELRRNLHLIDDTFRQDANNKQLFIDIISQDTRVNFVLRRMNRYGVLAAYIPAFANIVGRMQYDLFHIYTVDDHTLHVVRNIRRLSTPQGAEDNPFCSALFAQLKHPELLVLAGIFHDIAKGRKGSHSELGAVDALEFCREHALSEQHAQRVSWLVEQHLFMSGTAQRKDINDPDVVTAFTQIVDTQEKLDLLYILTICDIKGTNPTLLTSWKHSLLKTLHQHSTHKLAQTHASSGTEVEGDTTQVEQTKQRIRQRLSDLGLEPADCEAFWQRFNEDYFKPFSDSQLLWHLRELAKHPKTDTLVRVRDSEKGDGTQVLIYVRDQQQLFTKVTSAIEELYLNIVAANIHSSNDGYALLRLYVLNQEGQMLSSAADKHYLQEKIANSIAQSQVSYNFAHHRMPRQLKHFETKTSISFALNQKQQQTVITIKTSDAAGLLTRIAEVFNQQSINIHSARITTLGETAEDIFQVTSHSGKMITDPDKFAAIEAALLEKLAAG